MPPSQMCRQNPGFFGADIAQRWPRDWYFKSSATRVAWTARSDISSSMVRARSGHPSITPVAHRCENRSTASLPRGTQPGQVPGRRYSGVSAQEVYKAVLVYAIPPHPACLPP